MRKSVPSFNFLTWLYGFFVCFSFETHAQTQNYNIDDTSRAAVQVIVDNATGSGTLIIVDGKPTVFTNRHVVEGFDQATIAVLVDPNAPAEPMFIANLVGFSQEYDFAVYTLATDLQGNTVSAQQLRDGSFGVRFPDITVQDIDNKGSDVRRGDTVGIFGYPGIGDDELVYTTGIISSVQFGEYKGERLPMWYRTNAEMSPGNSGGMALNGRGEFIGIPTSVRTENLTGGRLGSLLAVPFVMAILEDDEGLVASWSGVDSSIAASELNILQEPGFGSVTLAPSELGEPFFAELISGGSVDVSYLGNNCVGFAASNPDYRIALTDDMTDMTILFLAEDEGADTTLIVNAPDGRWHCNDDESDDSRDPGLLFTNATSGQYDIWIGSYDQNDAVSGVLAVVDASDFDNIESSVGAQGTALDFAADPYYGSADLAAGFTPDPHVVSVSAGGAVDVSIAGYGNECRGFASSAPDYKVTLSGDSALLQLYFVASSIGDDATLIINNPEGTWLCNDDAPSSLNPGITINNPVAGRYDIWVGAYAQGEFINGELRITELSTTVP
ncbi:serine protease [Gammaproteobacteria bacterium LSUCC0112]|nr:serine protease [Gammaproteobacteria bacterium LSUCC0112]